MRPGPSPDGRTAGASVHTIHVVIPVHDEEALLARCLDAVGAARTALLLREPQVVVTVTVVLDGCTDRSPAVAAAHGVEVVEIAARSVGVARASGVAYAARRPTGGHPSETWIVTTDADSAVSPSWLVEHHAAAQSGCDLLIGSVRPDPDDLHPRSLALWHRRHRGHDLHIHGANLGVRLSAYLKVGGFRPVTEHEDILFVQDVRAAGLSWATGSWVVTSAREQGRTPGGFARYVTELNQEIAQSDAVPAS